MKERAICLQLFCCYSWSLCCSTTLFSRCIYVSNSLFWSSLPWFVAISLLLNLWKHPSLLFREVWFEDLYLLASQLLCVAVNQTTETEIKITNAILHSRPVTVTSSWLLFNIIKIHFISPTYFCYTSILHSPSTATSQTNRLSIPSITLIPTSANRSLLTPVSALLGHTQAKLPSHGSSLQRRDAVFCNNSSTRRQPRPWGSHCFVLPRAANACVLAPLSALRHFHFFACLSDSFHVAFPSLCSIERCQLSIFCTVHVLDLMLCLRCYQAAKCDTFSRLASR